ncbi:MAG TPA: protein kinase [Archangium sp.]|nr:protein kinase [Archangium sp.]
MSEEVGVQPGASQRLLHRHQQLQQAQLEPEPFLPAPGTEVAGFTLLAPVGKGGFGTVYLAQRDQGWYALKFIFLPRAEAWARRELEVMLRLHARVGPKLEAHGYWREPPARFLYLAMEYIPGRTARDWARVDNPSAWAVAGLLRTFSQQLAVVHAAGVVHRDVKLHNVLVREDGRPVLLDFGASTYVGAPEVTGPQPPTTRPYRSPEAVRFARAPVPGQRSARPLDDVWALGVMGYWLLTGHYPFEVEQPDPDDALGDAILHQEPQAPHLLNPRVPQALSEVCLRLLRKAPEERYPDARAVDEALQALMKEGKEEAAWHEPLCAAWGPDTVTTVQEAVLSEEGWRRRAERVEAYKREHPVRGVPVLAAEPEAALPLSGEEFEGEYEEEPLDAPALEESAESPAPAAPGVPSSPKAELAAQAWEWRPWAVAALAPVLLLAAVLLARGGHRQSPSPVRPPSVQWEEAGALGQEVAPPWRAPEGGQGAVPPWAPTPAPVARATPPEDMPVKTPSPQAQQPKKQALRRTLKAVGAATCTALAGCPAAQVLPNPPSEPCPPGAVEAMEKLGLLEWPPQVITGVLLDSEDATARVLVRSGSSAALRVHSKQVASISGRWLVGEGRLYARFTEGKLRNGESIPVCFELYDENDEKAGYIPEGFSGPDTARIWSALSAMPVRRFE